MEVLSTIAQYVNSDKLQQSIPEYLWFVIAIMGIGGFLIILRTMINYLISNLNELKKESMQHSEEIAAIHQTLIGIKEILVRYGEDIRDIRGSKPRR